ncbi:hypothetical protein GTHT12_03403 [Geobacillus thermodenitrificans]|nr:hypothetical protein GTHT12_03403 [Geobacillus thermodenitrificans]
MGLGSCLMVKEGGGRLSKGTVNDSPTHHLANA